MQYGTKHSLHEGLLLTAALQDHLQDLNLLAWAQRDLHQLVPRLLKVHAGHDGQVDRTPQVDQVSL